MKKLLLILLCLPMIGFGQQTYVPDDNFEAYLEANGMGNGIPNDEYVTTANINTVPYLNVGNQFISDLTGIEDFIALIDLECSHNQITSLDVSYNTVLSELYCTNNQLTSLNVSGATALTHFHCEDNQLTSLDVSNNTALEHLFFDNNELTNIDLNNNTLLSLLDCHNNELINIDLSNNTLLEFLECPYNQLTTLNLTQNTVLEMWNCEDNQLTNLDVRNGNNTNFTWFRCSNNPNLICINVDDSTWSANNWTVTNGDIDPQHYFSNNCPPTSIKEHTTNKEPLKVIDLLGRETKQTNQPLFYIYDDGTVEKRIVIE